MTITALRTARSVGAAAAMLILLAGGSAHAALKQWNNALGGSVTTPGNWTPSGVPGAGDDLDFSIVGTYSVTFLSPVTSSNSVIVHRGNITVTLNNTHTSTALFRIADSAEFCSLTITTGTMQSAVNAILGNGPAGVGTLKINDADALFQTTSATSDINVGHAGGGVLEITNGGRVISSDDILIANMHLTSGVATVNGFNAGAAQSSSMITTADNGDILVGWNGEGTLHVQDGGQVTSADDVLVASNGSSMGTVNVGGFGLTNSTLTATDALDVSRNDNSNPGGIGTLNVNADGVVMVGGSLRVGDPHGGTGRANVNGTGVINVTGSFSSLGEVTLDGGTISASQLLLEAGFLRGAGTINAPVDATSASVTVKPGMSAGVLNINSTYTQDGASDTGALLEMELGGSKAGQYDQLAVTGAASLGGTLRVLLINPFVPQGNDEYALLTAASVSGTFDTVELPALGPNREWELNYNADSVVLRVIVTGTCEGDGTGDGFVNIDDLLLVINGWGATGVNEGDINGNGVVDIDDLLAVINAWGTCP